VVVDGDDILVSIVVVCVAGFVDVVCVLLMCAGNAVNGGGVSGSTVGDGVAGADCVSSYGVRTYA